jgi:hypothetical protein
MVQIREDGARKSTIEANERQLESQGLVSQRFFTVMGTKHPKNISDGSVGSCKTSMHRS